MLSIRHLGETAYKERGLIQMRWIVDNLVAGPDRETATKFLRPTAENMKGSSTENWCQPVSLALITLPFARCDCPLNLSALPGFAVRDQLLALLHSMIILSIPAIQEESGNVAFQDQKYQHQSQELPYRHLSDMRVSQNRLISVSSGHRACGKSQTAHRL